MRRSERWWRWPGSWRCYCTGYGSPAKYTSRCGIARPSRKRVGQHKGLWFCNPSPSSGDCEVAAERALLETEATQFDAEMAAPVRRRTPTGTGATLHKRVRMEAGRVGEGQEKNFLRKRKRREGRGASRWSAIRSGGRPAKDFRLTRAALSWKPRP